MSQDKRTAKREATTGLDDKGDALVHISPAKKGSGISLEITSKVESMFGDQIRTSALEVLDDYRLTDVKVSINDKGALDYALRARLIVAIERSLRN